MTATIDAQNIMKQEISRFANYLCAYQECTEEVQAIVREMAAIIQDAEATDDEREHAVDVMIETMFPGLVVDFLEAQRQFLRTPASQEAKQELDKQEKHFADTLRRLMEERNLTQQDLAANTGVSQPAISNILNRQRRPQQRTVLKLAEALSVSPDTLWPPLREE